MKNAIAAYILKADSCNALVHAALHGPCLTFNDDSRDNLSLGDLSSTSRKGKETRKGKESLFSKHVKILAPLYCGINWPLELKFTPPYYSLNLFIQSLLAFLKSSTSTFNVRNIVLEDAQNSGMGKPINK